MYGIVVEIATKNTDFSRTNITASNNSDSGFNQLESKVNNMEVGLNPFVAKIDSK